MQNHNLTILLSFNYIPSQFFTNITLLTCRSAASYKRLINLKTNNRKLLWDKILAFGVYQNKRKQRKSVNTNIQITMIHHFKKNWSSIQTIESTIHDFRSNISIRRSGLWLAGNMLSDLCFRPSTTIPKDYDLRCLWNLTTSCT